MWAAAYGREDSVQLLLSHGADRGLRDNRGKTAVDMAREAGHANVVALLGRP